MSVSLNGNDITIINDRILADLADGDAVVLDFANNIADGKKGKNNNSVISYNATGEVVNVTVRVLKGSADDKFFNRELSNYKNNKPGYVLMSGEFIKREGDGTGAVVNDAYVMSGGFITKYPNAKENVEGDTEQGVTEYALTFMNSDRSIA